MISENGRFKINNHYLYMPITFVAAFIIFSLFIIFENDIYNVFDIVNFLTWHTLLEIASVIFSFIIFNNCYHSYINSRRIRLLILAVTFFIVGSIDFLHTISYEGMPYTFIQSSASVATIFWIIARLFMAVGILLASIIPFDKKIKLDEKFIFLLSIILTFIVFYVGTYKTHILPQLYIKETGLTKHKIYLEYSVIILLALAIYFYSRTYSKTQNKYIMILCSGIILNIFSGFLFTLYKNIYDTYNLLGHTYKVVGFYLIYHSIFKYNIYKPYVELKKAQSRIELYANNLEKIVDRRTREIRRVSNRLLTELDYAKNIQQCLLPPKIAHLGNVSFVSEYIPCERLSGDFFDIYKIDEDNIGMYILDVAGHGISSALLTMFCSRYIRSTERLIKRYRGLKPHKNLKYFYEEFNKLNFPEEMYLVLFYASYNVKTKILKYCSAGMNCYPILVRSSGEYEFLNKSRGFAICRFGNLYSPEYESSEIRLNKGDKVIFYTDGLIDKKKNGCFGKGDLIDILVRNSKSNAETLSKNILGKFTNVKDEIEDDITYFIMEVK